MRWIAFAFGIVYLGFVAAAFAAVSCDGTHIHAADPSYAKGKWFGCSGSEWRDASDSNKICMKSSWSTTDGKFARDTIQNAYGDCIEMQVHCNGNSMGTITWGSNSSSASLDYDSGDYNIDIHLPMFGSVAYNSGYVQNWIKCARSDVIGTSYVIQDHISSSGKYCLDIYQCELGAIRSNKDGSYLERPREWYSSWSNGDRH
jgi:hypothetical protein